jgi:hypothetical protein
MDTCPPTIFPRLANLALHHVACFNSMYADGGPNVNMIGVCSMTMEGRTLIDAGHAYAAIQANLKGGLLVHHADDTVTVSPAGLAAMIDGGPYPRYLAEGGIIG